MLACGRRQLRPASTEPAARAASFLVSRHTARAAAVPAAALPATAAATAQAAAAAAAAQQLPEAEPLPDLRWQSQDSLASSISFSRSWSSSGGDGEGDGHGGVAPRRRWSPMHARLLSSLRQRKLLPPGSRVLVAVSGGQDSMALLAVLADLQQLLEVQLVVAHCDHGMRPDSRDSAAFVQHHARQLGLPCCSVATSRKLRSEAAARDWRHEQLALFARQTGCSCIALGHTATDRAETLLLHMIRGAGARGLGSMGWSRQLDEQLALVRPLLDFSREETAEFCSTSGIQAWQDATNSDTRFARNALRLGVFPLLYAVNARAVRHMARASELLRDDDDLLQLMAARLLRRAVMPVVLAPALPAGGSNGSASSDKVAQAPDELCSRPAAAYGCVAGVVATAAVSAHCSEAVSSAEQQQPQHRQWRQQQRRRRRQQQEQQEHSFRGARMEVELQVHVSGWSRSSSNSDDSDADDGSSSGGAGGSTGILQALQLQRLTGVPRPLKLRVLRTWLEHQAQRAASYDALAEVLRIADAGTHGSRSSSLCGDSCVLRYERLLLVLEQARVTQLLGAQLQLVAAATAVQQEQQPEQPVLTQRTRRRRRRCRPAQP